MNRPTTHEDCRAQKEPFDWRGIVWVAAQVPLLALAFCLPGSAFGHRFPWPAEGLPFRSALSAVLMIGGGVLLAAGIIGLGRSLTPLPAPKSDGKLVTNGVYRLVRHPMYGGIMMLALAHALLITSGTALAFPALLTLFFDRKATAEEEMLARKFSTYDDYRTRSAKLIPWLY